MATKGTRDYRPKLHFTPKRAWINDPNGLVKQGDTYHLFAQYYPNDTVWGPMHWLHATSKDLIHWDELGIAIAPDEQGMIFSGSAVVDERNTAGFGAGALIAMYTSHGDAERQAIAYSVDGVHFEKYGGNPVIDNPGLCDFRDPKVFWNEKLGCWSAVIAAGERVMFYSSPDLRHWTYTGDFGAKENKLGTVFECPDVFPLTAPDGASVWVLSASMIQDAKIGGNRSQYFLGEFDGSAFTQTVEMKEPVLLDSGYDNYAAVTFAGSSEPLMLGWGSSWTYAREAPTGDYCGCMTLARRLALRDSAEGLRLTQWPVLPEGAAPQPIGDGGALGSESFALRIRAQGAFEAALTNAKGERFVFGLNVEGTFYTDRSHSGEMRFHKLFNAPLYQHTAAKRLAHGEAELLAVFDRSIAELYADGGLYVNTSLMFPTQPYESLALQGGTAQIERF